MMKSRFALILLILLAFGGGSMAEAKSHHDWERSMGRLHAGDRLHIALKSGPVDATFVSSTGENFTADSGTMNRADVLKIERIQSKHGGGRGKHTLIGTLIGVGGGAAVGALIGHLGNSSKSCPANGSLVPCNLNLVTTGEFTAGGAGVGAVFGAVVGALVPSHGTKHETIYSAK